MADSVKLRDLISKRGLKLKYVAEAVHLSPYGLQLKIDNKNEFRDWHEYSRLHKIYVTVSGWQLSEQSYLSDIWTFRKEVIHMPRVAIKRKEYKVSDLSKWIAAKMYETGLKQKHLADLIGISQPAFSYRLQKGQFDYKEMLILFEELGATDDEIINLMKLSKKTKVQNKRRVG